MTIRRAKLRSSKIKQVLETMIITQVQNIIVFKSKMVPLRLMGQMTVLRLWHFVEEYGSSKTCDMI